MTDQQGSDDLGPAEQLAPADDAYVASLLAGLPPVRMPDDVAARVTAALAAEPPVTRATTTVVPLDERRARREAARSSRANRLAAVAAAFVVVAAGGALAVGMLKDNSSSGGTASARAEQSDDVTHTGHTYTDQAITADVTSLVADALPTQSPLPLATDSGTDGQTASGTGSPTAPPTVSASGSREPTSAPPSVSSPTAAPTAVDISSLWTSDASVVPCLAAVEEGLAQVVEPLAMDVGTYAGQPALVVVLPSSTDPETAYDVFVVGIRCGESADAHLLTYKKVPKQ